MSDRVVVITGASAGIGAAVGELLGRRGTRVALGTIAVDPSVIPMGSLVYVKGYGWARALDTGGAIRGKFIDVWFPTLGQCYQWGSRPVEVVVFPPGNR